MLVHITPDFDTQLGYLLVMRSVAPPFLRASRAAAALSSETRALATRRGSSEAASLCMSALGKQQLRHAVAARMISTTNRTIHSSSSRTSPPADHIVVLDPESKALPSRPEPPETMAGQSPPLAVLPLLTVLRSLAVTTISSSPLLLPPSLAIMSTLAHTTNPVLDADRNPVLRFLIKNSFYAQFCAGETPREVRQTVDRLKSIGFSGVILGYAREVVLTDEQTRDLASCGEGDAAEECIRTEIVPWAAGTMETVRLASPGDFVALKYDCQPACPSLVFSLFESIDGLTDELDSLAPAVKPSSTYPNATRPPQRSRMRLMASASSPQSEGFACSLMPSSRRSNGALTTGLWSTCADTTEQEHPAGPARPSSTARTKRT